MTTPGPGSRTGGGPFAPEIRAQARFGTFGGVFTPCTLTILGVIMFMRSGYVVGESGLWRALLILLLAKSITTLTTLSLSAIATNTEVRTGGVYYMISRTLGADFGGTIGLTLFVSQAVAVAFYVIGFAEALLALLPAPWSGYPGPQLVATVAIGGLFAVTFKGADLAIRAQYVILAVLLASVASFLLGGLLSFDAARASENLGANPEGTAGFWLVFAIFFPAATGITAGANLSGDLKDPARSIPRGTLIAIGFTAGIYLLELVFLAGYGDRERLVSDPFGVLMEMSLIGPLVIAGVFAATLSSALSSLLGAPRILQAMGKDRLLAPLEYFAAGHGAKDEPRRATVFAMGIAVAVVWMGDLNAVARVISMFFLITYGMINLSAFVESSGGNPSFRPRFKLFGWPTAMAGTIVSVVAMVKLDEAAAIVAMLIAAALFFYLRRRAGGDWRDAKRGFVFKRARENLLLLEKSDPDPKNWRPAMLVITDDAERDRTMIDHASWLEARRGLLSVLELADVGGPAAGSGSDPPRRPDPEGALARRLEQRAERAARLKEALRERGITAIADSVVAEDVSRSLDVVLQSYSIGSLRPNTVMVSVPPPTQVERRARLARMLETMAAFNLNVVLYKGARIERVSRRRIDLWWHGQENGSLMALLAYLAGTNPEWSQTRIRMLRVVKNEEEHLEAEQDLSNLMRAARLDMDLDVILSERPVQELIAERSGSSDLVLLGLARGDLGDFGRFLAARDPLLAALPPTLLVRSNGDVDLIA